MMMLRSKLVELELEKREAEAAALRGEHVDASWGTQIRHYVLAPYQMVKDVRTSYETSDTDGVLNGEIDELMKAYLDLGGRARRQRLTPGALTPDPGALTPD